MMEDRPITLFDLIDPVTNSIPMDKIRDVLLAIQKQMNEMTNVEDCLVILDSILEESPTNIIQHQENPGTTVAEQPSPQSPYYTMSPYYTYTSPQYYGYTMSTSSTTSNILY